MMFTTERAIKFLNATDLFFDDDDDMGKYCLNLGDTFAWACADAERVGEDELPRLAELVWLYGYCGMLYWVSEKRGGMMTAFQDNNRMIEFVRHEEQIRSEIPDSCARALAKRSYMIGIAKDGL